MSWSSGTAAKITALTSSNPNIQFRIVCPPCCPVRQERGNEVHLRPVSAHRKSGAAFRASLAAILAVVLLAGCATAPPGADYPKRFSTAFATPEATQLGRQIAIQANAHPDLSGFQVLPRGVDGLLLRTQLIRAAERSVDIQYFIFVEDYTGKLLLESVLRAADRGVKVRLLIDDWNSFGQPEMRATLGENRDRADQDGILRRVDGGDPLSGLVQGRTSVSWAKAVVVADPPEKAMPASNAAASSPTARVLSQHMNDVTRELVIISPYFVPGPAGLATLEALRKRGVGVRILTNSLASTDGPIVHSPYQRYRRPLLNAGVGIF